MYQCETGMLGVADAALEVTRRMSKLHSTDFAAQAAEAHAAAVAEEDAEREEKGDEEGMGELSAKAQRRLSQKFDTDLKQTVSTVLDEMAPSVTMKGKQERQERPELKEEREERLTSK